MLLKEFQMFSKTPIRDVPEKGPNVTEFVRSEIETASEESEYLRDENGLDVEMPESSDSESEIELSIYEKRREQNAWQTVLAEKLFAETKKRIYNEKLKQLEKRQSEVWSQEAPDYAKKKAEIEKEHKDKLQYIEVIRALRTESLRRRTVAQLECAQQNLNNNKRLAYEIVEDDIQKRLQKLEDDMKRCTKEYVDFCREFERSRERERRKRRPHPIVNLIQNVLGEGNMVMADTRNEDIIEDLRICEQALKAVNGMDADNGSEQ